MIQRKSFPVYFKAVEGSKDTIDAVVSVFGNVDGAGDRVVKGAFADNLKAWQESGNPLPVIWSHTWENPFAHVGVVEEAEELAPGDERLPEKIRDLGGLWTRQKYDIGKEYADQVFWLVSNRRVKEFSFAYDIEEEEKADGANELRKLSIIEVGPTLKGMNSETQLLAAKSGLMGEAFKAALETQPPEQPEPETKSQEKAGRVLSAKNESKLREARDAIDAVLKSIEKDEPKERESAPGLSLYKTRIKTRIDIEELENTA